MNRYCKCYIARTFFPYSLCNTIMFGLGPTDDPQDGISLDDINCDDDTLTISSNMEDKP